ncbi:MAG: ERAP1-like C-terminal domain-containing protein, partial [Bdellovibrionaceae bacterium]|nr:ERAP1-like C-terminal domain-containing protein [Pseudobdellovibrionaceae bacterium]
NIPLRLYARKSLKKFVNAEEWFRATKEGLDFFPKYFNTPFPYTKYDQIIVPELSFGAMENVGAVTFSENYISRGRKTEQQLRSLKRTLLHEMAHMWFGNLVTMKWWNDLWLNESFATYMSSVAMSQNKKQKLSSMLDFNNNKEWAYWEDRLITTHPILTEVNNTDKAFSNFDGITYGKGAATLKQLVFYIGEDNFKKGLALYFQRHAEKNTTLADFISSLGEAAKIDLTAWQKKWLETAGVNQISAKFTCNDIKKIDSFKLIQSSSYPPEVLRPHKLLVSLIKKNKDGISSFKTVEARMESSETSITELVGQDCPDLVFPNYQDYAYVNVQLDSRSLNFIENNLQHIKDPLLKKMLWMDLWRMVRDGKYSVKNYGQLILKLAPITKDPDIFDSAMKFDEVLSYYPKKTKDEKKQLEDFSNSIELTLWNMLTSKNYTQDLKKQVLSIFLKSNRTSGTNEKLNNLLNSKNTQKSVGIVIDQDIRWQILKSLAQNNFKNSIKLINIEKKKDPSAKGQKEAFAAEASLPHWSLKKPWIDEFKNPNSTYSNSILTYVARSIFPSKQLHLRKKYAESFFQDLNTVIKNRDVIYAASFTNLSPTFCELDEPDLISPYLDKHPDLSPLVSKNLKIQRQESQYCVNIRNFSRENSLQQDSRI